MLPFPPFFFSFAFFFLLSLLALVFYSFLLQVLENEVDRHIDLTAKGDAGGAAIVNDTKRALPLPIKGHHQKGERAKWKRY